VEYDDGLIACAGDALVIRRYTLLLRPKHVPYNRIRRVTQRRLGTLRRWRIWGSGDLVHWFNFDPRRPHKDVALVLDLGERVKPVITPNDAGKVVELLRCHGVQVSGPA
jgi:hypothetical protein